MASREDNNSAREDKHPKGDLEVAYIIDDGGDGRFDWGVDDLEQGVKQVMGDFLNCITVEARNTFPVSAGSAEVSYQDNGYPAEFNTAGNSHQQSTFTSSEGLNNWDTDYLDSRSDVKMADYLSKGKTKNTTNSTGHNLLPKVKSGEGLTNYGKASVDDDGQGPVPKQVSQVLRSNRFSPTRDSTPFVAENQIPNSPGRIRDALGVFDTGEEITFDDIAKIGLSLMVKATGHDNDGDKDPTSGGVTANQLLPSALQTGATKIAANQLNASTAFPLSTVDRIALESDLTLDYKEDESRSYGALNSHVEPFDGFLPIGMSALSAALIPALLISTEVIFELISEIGEPKNQTPPAIGIKGSSRPTATGIVNQLIGPRQLGLFETQNRFQDAVAAGVNVFFGFEEADSLANFKASAGQALGTAALNVLQSPGYYAVVIRSILRSANTINREIQDVFKSGTFVESLQGTIGLIDVLKSSKVFAYLNMLAQLGDLELNKLAEGVIEKVGQKNDISKIDEIESAIDSGPRYGMVQRPRANVLKNRIKNENGDLSRKLSWRAGSAPAIYILPQSFEIASEQSDKFTPGSRGSVAGALEKKVYGSTTPGERIHPVIVEELENAMEAEYVPFYFHDLRTNEIISFHAFLSDLSDGFTANYESVDGYGRIEPVRIYRGAERSISLKFHVVSTSELDFDEMWWKINKLVTLLYPQWSSGRQLVNPSGDKFIQPFSQIPTSSPLIRLRVGDVVKSNYSKFNLSRLFGLGDDSKFGPGDLQQQIKESEAEIQAESVRYRNRQFQKGDTVNARALYGLDSKPLKDIEGLVKVVILQDPVDLGATPDPSKNFTSDKIYKVHYEDPEGRVTGDYRANHEDLERIITDDGSFDVAREQKVRRDTLRESLKLMQPAEFFNSENNPVVRSFESTKGRGLAGVITSMNFVWNGPTWETTYVGRKAPKFCEVSIDFKPIHDIAPGLDSDGFNRAPVYPVGDIINNAFGDVHGKSVGDLEDESKISKATQ